jgi:hypothetical protein
MVFHVEYPRVIPERKPEGHQPAAPRYTLRWQKPVGMMVSQYHAIQGANLPWDKQREFFDLAEKSFAEKDGASAHEIMRFVDEAGEVNAVVASYWLDATVHARWSARSKLSACSIRRIAFTAMSESGAKRWWFLMIAMRQSIPGLDTRSDWHVRRMPRSNP